MPKRSVYQVQTGSFASSQAAWSRPVATASQNAGSLVQPPRPAVAVKAAMIAFRFPMQSAPGSKLGL